MIDVLVPILGRPPHAMIDSLEQSTETEFKVFFICSPGDETVEECRIYDRYVTWVVEWKPGRADFAKKINWAYARTSSPWIFTGADDLRFHPDWDTEALRLADPALVIGTNDLHNPAVQADDVRHPLLIARVYIETYGGTYDGSGAVFSEVYDHQFVDTEFVEVAKQRKRWIFAERSVVEHLHPVWGFGLPAPASSRPDLHQGLPGDEGGHAPLRPARPLDQEDPCSLGSFAPCSSSVSRK